jgi:hypothetical protein
MNFDEPRPRVNPRKRPWIDGQIPDPYWLKRRRHEYPSESHEPLCGGWFPRRRDSEEYGGSGSHHRSSDWCCTRSAPAAPDSTARRGSLSMFGINPVLKHGSGDASQVHSARRVGELNVCSA